MDDEHISMEQQQISVRQRIVVHDIVLVVGQRIVEIVQQVRQVQVRQCR